MKIRFQIDYRTHWGQKVLISGSIPELGNGDISKALELSLTSGELWEREVEVDNITKFEYNYILFDENYQTHIWEFGSSRIADISADTNYLFRDFWRPKEDQLNSLYTAPFYKAFFRRDKTENLTGKRIKNAIRLQLRAPRIGKYYSFGIVGSLKSLGEWDDSGAMKMSDSTYPVWSAEFPVVKNEFPFEYKFVIIDNRTNKVVTWEQRNNRYLPLHHREKSQITVWTDEYFHYPVGNWKAAGSAIPVFSLRSEKGTGVGEFSDLFPYVDWSVKTGMKLVQVLPVNDTVATHSWIDSYPYAAISVHALHPIYANLQKIGKLRNEKLQKEIDKARTALNKKVEVDYEEVMKVKSKFFKASFDENKNTFIASKEYKRFKNENENWLRPYSVFSALRDKFGTPDFTKWEKYAVFDHKLVSEYENKHTDDVLVHHYIQFHLDKQLKEVTEYARKNGVVLKGDIPIGIYRNSLDAWMYPGLFNMDCQAGAPPDDFSISGQNWGFPTYNWEEMEKDGFSWWKERLTKMSDYFDVFRIDHILGFFRIWEIPYEHVEGIMGRFNPALPYRFQEFNDLGIHFDKDRFTKPYIRKHVIHHIFNSHSDTVIKEYLHEYSHGKYEFKEEYNTQRKIKAFFDQKVLDDPKNSDFHNWMRFSLYRLHSEVLFLEAPLSDGQAFNPRIAFHSTFSYSDLDPFTKQKLDELYNHYFYHRHNDFWRDSAMKKLPSLKEATDMLICGEDLGMVPACVPGVMDDLSILSLAIQRMPNDDRDFWHPSDTSYLSVTSTGSHDMSTLREWWQESMDKTQKFFNNILGHFGGAPFYCEPWIAKDIVNQHLHSPSMWAIFPLQDLLAMDSALRREVPEEERINVPSNPQHYWKYRMHLNIEDLKEADGFNGMLRQLIDQGGRKADY